MIDVAALDNQLFVFIQQFTGNRVIDFFFLAAAETVVLLVPMVLVYLWFDSAEGRRDSLFTFAATVTGIAATYLLGLLYFHHQPFHVYDTIVSGRELNNAFASQHTATMFSVFWSFLYLKRRKLAWVFGTTGLLTGFGRVFVGLHYPLDILGGILSGLIGVLVLHVIWDPLKPVINELIEKSYMVEEKIYGLFSR